MDWDATPWADVLAALREADWSGTRPRPVAETLAGLGPPPLDPAELGGRLKCNAWCYRATYGLAVAAPPVLVPLIPFVRFGVPSWGWRSAASAGGLVACLAVALANDAAAASVSGRVLRVARRVAPGLASRMRAAQGSSAGGGLGAPPRGGTSGLRVAGLRRPVTAAGLGALALLLVLAGGGLAAVRRAAASSLLGLALVAAHAACRAPDLKARLSSAREDFRAAWAGGGGGGGGPSFGGGGGAADALRGRMSASGGVSFTGAPLGGGGGGSGPGPATAAARAHDYTR